ncbi:hypothetical protein ACSSVW_000372 [Pseudoalteromonas sp. MBR-15]|jgi:hypothetical protein
MFLNLTAKHMLSLNSALSVLFLGVGVYGILSDDALPFPSFSAFVAAVFFALQAVRSTDKFAAKTALSNTLIATNTHLKVTQFYYSSKEQLLELNRITEFKVADNYLAVILDKNGQGYDFQIKGKSDAIIERLNDIIPHQALKNTSITRV